MDINTIRLAAAKHSRLQVLEDFYKQTYNARHSTIITSSSTQNSMPNSSAEYALEVDPNAMRTWVRGQMDSIKNELKELGVEL